MKEPMTIGSEQIELAIQKMADCYCGQIATLQPEAPDLETNTRLIHKFNGMTLMLYCLTGSLDLAYEAKRRGEELFMERTTVKQ